VGFDWALNVVSAILIHIPLLIKIPAGYGMFRHALWMALEPFHLSGIPICTVILIARGIRSVRCRTSAVLGLQL